ncbi:MAG TPA: IS6 family transposase [Oligoflexus sp.]|uniref:IS6 family transposase n=1 Tax=Oligoflexus sp. TaxID=1971216 RepID=UPI002D3C950E|nr:IS6 family transposase [Oligoflexus sp.]HYX36195.1 IS6 family transposase [Oligoflexus sp.]
MALRFKGRYFQKSIILTCIRWYLSYKLSTRDLEEMMAERGAHVDHSTIHRWVLRYTPELEAELRKRKKSVSASWFWDEMAIKVKGKLKWLYRAVDSDGDTMDFLMAAKRDQKAAIRFLKKAIRQRGVPEKINTDRSGANASGLKAFNHEHSTDIELRQLKYLNTIVKQDHRRVRQRTRPMMGFKTFMSAAKTIAGIEMMVMIKNVCDRVAPKVVVRLRVNRLRSDP